MGRNWVKGGPWDHAAFFLQFPLTLYNYFQIKFLKK